MVVPAAEVYQRISARWPLIPVVHERSETARKYRFADGRGEIGLIAPVTQPFCGHCSRIRLDRRRKIAHLPFQQGRSRLEGNTAQRRNRSRNRRRDHRNRATKGKESPHQRSRFCSAFAYHGLYWWLILELRDSLATVRTTSSSGAGQDGGRRIQIFLADGSGAAAFAAGANPDRSHGIARAR